MRRFERLKIEFAIISIITVAEIAAYVVLFATGILLEDSNLIMIFGVLNPIVIVLFFITLYLFLHERTLENELKNENLYNLDQISYFKNYVAFEREIKKLRKGKFKKSTGYCVAFSVPGQDLSKSGNRNSVITTLNSKIAEYMSEYFTTKGNKIAASNVYCYYHGYFLLYSFSSNEFIDKFISDFSMDIFRIAEENEIHVFIQPFFGVAEVNDPKENVIKSVDNALSARYFSEKNFQEKTYYTEGLYKTTTEDDIEDIAKGLDNKEFIVYYQPKFSLKENKFNSAEALVRWNSPKLGILTPDAFLPKAEVGGLIHKIDMYVFRRVCEDLSETRNKGRRLVPISVNFSMYEFYSPTFLNDIMAIIKEFELDTKYIEIEITETTSQANSFLAVSYMKKLKEAGIGILLDDFGIGYSNIINVTKLPITKLKIDKSLLDNIIYDVKSRESVKFLCSLCSVAGLESIAEGVDSEEQVDILKKIKCDTIQGYYYAHPMPIDELNQLLISNKFEKKTRGGSDK